MQPDGEPERRLGPIHPAYDDFSSEPAYRLDLPDSQRLPLVFASPHSGRHYPARFVAASRLDPRTLRRSEDCYVEELFAAAPGLGAPLLQALFPRAYVDVNREPYELDPKMFNAPLPDFVNRHSPRVAAGLGTLARVVGNGQEIYRDQLIFAEAATRLRRCYWPYHHCLADLVEQTRRRFGFCVLIDCHSMPSNSVGGLLRPGVKPLDMVLGDCFGTSCAPEVSDVVQQGLTRMGYRTLRNKPYAGGFVTRHYGRPSAGVHVLQIELNRKLYIDEASYQRTASFGRLADHLAQLIQSLGQLDLGRLAAE
jgi:N-formylglutamate amidohydrolase|tara:strand:+ start:3492 stop:4418 length:927 start_codon:yes stop_codon:yes gene_type:complete